MFVYLPRRAGCGIVATVFAVAAAACSQGDVPSDLRTDGDPEVLTVTVLHPDTRVIEMEVGNFGALVEGTTYCKTIGPYDQGSDAGDPKRPSEVNTPDFLTPTQMCPDDLTQGVPELTDASPTSWFARIEFSKLLDPNVEDLIDNGDGTYTGTLRNTQPVKLQCNDINGNAVDVPYDGYYSPSGNSESYPLGPSLVIIPNNATTVPTMSECSVTIIQSKVLDKDGNEVYTDQLGPYKWKIATIEAVATVAPGGSPVDPIVAAEAQAVNMYFNAPVTLAGSNFTWTPADGMATSDIQNPYAEQVDAAGQVWGFGGDFPVGGATGMATTDGSPYTLALVGGSGSPTFTDQCGQTVSVPVATATNNEETQIALNPLLFSSVQPALSPADMIQLEFNQFMDPTTLDASEFTISPQPANFAVQINPASEMIEFYGNYKLGTQYAFTLNSGATINDCPGAEFASCAPSTTFTNSSPQTLMFTTAAAIELNQVNPADNTEVTVGGITSIDLIFNQEIDPTTVTEGAAAGSGAYTIVDSTGAIVPATVGEGPAGHGDVSITPSAAGGFAAGSYVFTLNGSGSVSDFTGGTFSNGTDVVVNFTLDPATTTTTTCIMQ